MKTECNAIFLFIAELAGSFKPGSGTVDTKIKSGQKCYINNVLHELDLSKEEDRKELHENVWLQRLYDELDEYFEVVNDDGTMRFFAIDLEQYREDTFKWAVPIELDASASMLQYEGLLTGDERLLEMTNVIGDTLEDPWKLEGMPRRMLKEAATPMLYGSNQACDDLWQKSAIPYTSSDIERYTTEMANGPFGVANLLKEFIINNATPKKHMKVAIWDETFDISCNRHRNVGEKTKAYKIWDTLDKQYNTLQHTDTKKIPDLDQFKRYFMTLLIHNLDSQVADTVIGKVMKKYGWGIPIHDAFVVSPAAAEDTRKWYAEELTRIYNDREKILQNYFRSIGITKEATGQWQTLQGKIQHLKGELNVNPMALK